MIDKKTWKQFRDVGLLWWINTILHMFGWAIVCQFDKGEIVDVYPARVRFRGFGEDDNTEGYRKVTEYLKDNIEQLSEESKE